jgi:hypothetical protein
MPDDRQCPSQLLSYAPRSPRIFPAVVRMIVGLAAAAALLVLAWRVAREPAAPRLTPDPFPVAESSVQSPAPPPAAAPSAAEVYRREIAPRLHDFEWRNAIAVDRAVGALRERMDVRRQGVQPFARDITSWGTRFGVIGRKAGDTSRRLRGRPSVDSVNLYVSQKFRQHILSERLLQADITAVLMQLEEELAASRNLLYADLRLPLAKIDAPLARTDADYERFQEQVRRDVEAMATKMGTDSVTQGIAAFAGGWVVGDVAQLAARQLVTQVIARTGTQLAVQGVAAGGATAGGATTGGGVGSFGGPAGTVIGVGVGIAVGAAVDWWMSKRFEEKLVEKCNAYLDSLRDLILDGTDSAPGLEAAMRGGIAVTAATQRTAILKAMGLEKS